MKNRRKDTGNEDTLEGVIDALREENKALKEKVIRLEQEKHAHSSVREDQVIRLLALQEELAAAKAEIAGLYKAMRQQNNSLLP